MILSLADSLDTPNKGIIKIDYDNKEMLSVTRQSLQGSAE
jgi:hypothetical protein